MQRRIVVLATTDDDDPFARDADPDGTRLYAVRIGRDSQSDIPLGQGLHKQVLCAGRVIHVGLENAAREGRNFSVSMASSGPHAFVHGLLVLSTSRAGGGMLVAAEDCPTPAAASWTSD